MLREERFHYILEKLRTERKVLLAPLSAELNVSEDTIRRDIEALAQGGLLSKVRGGAVPHAPIPAAYHDREQHAQPDKQEIARKAAQLFADGQTVLLDGGTTAYWVAKYLPTDLRLTVVTHSLPVANALLDHPFVDLMLVGGRVLKNSRIALGAETVARFRRIRADLCLVGAYGLHHQIGLTVADPDEAEANLAMVQAAGQVVALATPEKLETAEPFIVCPPEALHKIITTDAANPEHVELYRGVGIEVL